MNYAEKVKFLHTSHQLSYRQIEKYVFPAKKMHGTYAMRVEQGTKRLTSANKNRITRLYKKYSNYSKYPITDFVSENGRFHNLNVKELETIDKLLLERLYNNIDDTIHSKLHYRHDYYIIAVGYYPTEDMDEDVIEDVFYSFQGIENMLNTVKRASANVDKSELLGGIWDTKNNRMLDFDKITEKEYWDMERML